MLAAEELRRFGLTPSVALLSHSSFRERRYTLGTEDARRAGADPGCGSDLAVDGEMHGDAALAKQVLDRVFWLRPRRGRQSSHHAQSGFGQHLLQPIARRCSGGVTVGPILLGAGKPVHILTQSATVRGILNMTALAAVDATQINPRATTKPATMRKSIA